MDAPEYERDADQALEMAARLHLMAMCLRAGLSEDEARALILESEINIAEKDE
jgi:hypothetical protein